jgi:adenine deaminase
MNLKKLTPTERRELVDAAAGRIPVELLIVNVQIINVFTGEIYPGVIGIRHGYIAYAFESEDPSQFAGNAVKVHDGQGAYAVPGFIDSHVHIESSMLTPRRFAELVIPHGTTTIVTDPHEIGNVLGIDGVEYMIEAGRDLPMYQLALAPSCVPAVPGLEESGAEFGRDEIARLLDNDRILGIAEVMDFQGVVRNSERMREILDLGFERECFIQGHYFGDGKHELAAYLCAGPSSNHEIFTPEAAKAAARAGMIVDARDSSFSRDVEAIVGALKQYGRMPNFTICTDDREPAQILRDGHINDCTRHAIESGMEPVDAIRAATLNTAALYKLDKLGAIAPGYIANINLVDDPGNLGVKAVFFEGALVAADGKLSRPIAEQQFAIEAYNSVHIGALNEADLTLKVPGGVQDGSVRVRVIHYPDADTLETQMVVREVAVRDGKVVLDGNEDLNFIAVVNRHAGKTGMSVGLVSNFFLKQGALAGTVSHDSHNLTLVYRDPSEVLSAVEKVVSSRGGVVYVNNGQAYPLELPVAGLMSSGSIETCISQVETLNRVLRDAGIQTSNPVMRLATAALPVIPNIKISDKGLIDVLKAEFIDLFV